ncbi:hypothetical protein P12x_002486 [Tundrisphaera lichenicola]|uniref:hypothetical protein n=1 Tax=Tundrisphaera lichenicola TaxID=2029860 RepID=UPI003EBFCFEF
MSEPGAGEFDRPRSKFTIGRLMIAVALGLPLLLMLREDGYPLAGALIVGDCILILAYKLANEAMERDRARGKQRTASHIVWTGLSSLMWSVLIIGLADFAFLVLCLLVASPPRHFHRRILFELYFASTIVVVFATSLIRRAIRREAPARARMQESHMKVDFD